MGDFIDQKLSLRVVKTNFKKNSSYGQQQQKILEHQECLVWEDFLSKGH